ncbi:MAG: sulfatase-like hydrolase/transferase [Planctomycetota bacterium]
MARPNLLYIMCDELRWSEVGAYGHPVVRTPNFDAFAQQGTRFETAVSNCPVCVPARSIVLSGQHARRSHGLTGNGACHFTDHRGNKGWCFYPYAPKQREAFPDATFPELLKSAGYHTAAIGKWHVDAWPHHLGFDDYLIPRAHHAHAAQLFTHNGGPEFAAPGFSVDYEADKVCEFFDQRTGQSEPWMMYYNISPPHMPLAEQPEKYLTMYDPAEVVLRGNEPVPFDNAAKRNNFTTYLWDYRDYFAQLPHAKELPDGFTLEHLLALYYGATTWVDDVLGRVLAGLEQSGMADDTIVIFTADHGDNFGCHDRFGKAKLLEESYRVPMAVRGPGVRARVCGDTIGSLVDIGPTLLEAAGVDVPAHMHGTSLMPTLTEAKPGPAHAFIESAPDGVGVRTLSHLYGIGWEREPTLGERCSIFTDLETDPLQMSPLPDEGDLATELRGMVEAFDARTPWMQS